MGSIAEDSPRVFEGPPINNQPTIVTIFNQTQLLSSPYVPSLIKTVNTAFRVIHASRPELGMSLDDRIGSPDQFTAALSLDPATFIIVISHPGSHEVIATANCRHYYGPNPGNTSPWARTIPREDDADEWELKLMAVNPDVQKQGVAGYMLKLVEEEIVKRSQADLDQRKGVSNERHTDTDVTLKRVRMVLCTPREMLGSFYAKRGYHKDYEVERGEGMNFHIIFMSKDIGTLV